MSQTPHLLAFAGSARKDSYNKKLIRLAAEAARAAGAEVTLVDLKDFPMPLFNQDLEAESGLPETVKQFKQLMKTHGSLLLACPEYNSSITPLLKNTIDWCSRQEQGEEPLVCFRGKVAALLSASPGALGGLRGLVHVRSILGNIGVLVLPDQVAIVRAHEAFNTDGSLKQAAQQSAIEAVATTLAKTVMKLKTA